MERFNNEVRQIKAVVKKFGVRSSSFLAPPDDVVIGTARALSFYKSLTDHPQPYPEMVTLFALAAEDSITFGMKSQLEGLTVMQCRNQLAYIGQFMSRKVEQNIDSYSRGRIDFVKTQIDKVTSKALAEDSTSWLPGSRLYTVRQRLGITPDKERPFRILAMNRTADEMALAIGVKGMMMYMDGLSYLVVDKDAESLPHEYGHSQIYGIVGFGGRIFKSFEEGFIETLVPKSTGYPEYRNVVNDLMMWGDERMNKLIIDAEMGRGKARSRFLSLMIRRGGLRALNYLGWMGDSSADEHAVHPEIVLKFMREHLIDRATEDTKSDDSDKFTSEFWKPVEMMRF